MKRFAIDERVGCIAIIDTLVTQGSECIEGMTNIVWRKIGGRETNKRKRSRGIYWKVSRKTKCEARKMCRKLNRQTKAEGKGKA